MKRTLQVLSLSLVLGTTALATANALPRGGEPAAVVSADGAESMLSTFMSWMLGWWDADTDPTPEEPPPVGRPNGPFGDNGSCVDPDGQLCKGQ
jgi:hypothetical protein